MTDPAVLAVKSRRWAHVRRYRPTPWRCTHCGLVTESVPEAWVHSYVAHGIRRTAR